MDTALATEEFQNELQQLLVALYGPLEAGHGYTEAEREAAQARLGAEFPTVLRSCYQVAGQHPALRRGLQNLLSLDQLELRTFAEGEGLIFLTEMQEVTFSVIRRDALQTADPAVYQGNNQEQVLYLDSQCLSDFMLRTLCWNAIELLPSGGEAAITGSELEKLCSTMTPVGAGSKGTSPERAAPEGNDMQAFRQGRQIACVFPNPESQSEPFRLFVASHSDEELEQFQEATEIELSWL